MISAANISSMSVKPRGRCTEWRSISKSLCRVAAESRCSDLAIAQPGFLPPHDDLDQLSIGGSAPREVDVPDVPVAIEVGRTVAIDVRRQAGVGRSQIARLIRE